jgi:hypothetical protein
MKNELCRHLIFLLMLTLSSSYWAACQKNSRQAAVNNTTFPIRGLSFVAPTRPISALAMTEVKSVNANWIAVIPYGFSSTNPTDRSGKTQKLGFVRFHREATATGWGWGESPLGVRVCIDSAHKNGIKVMVKPQIWMGWGGWTGGMDYADDAAWKNWETDYEDYILTFAKVAEETKAELFCIGTEFKTAATKRPDFWRQLIKKIRVVYSGKLTYAANWDEYDVVPFWNDLDFVGIDAYFSLLQKDTPSVSDLKTAWQPTLNAIRGFQKKVNKPIIFTEYGYLDVDGCAFQSWDLEKKLKETPLNEQAQANAITALLQVFSAESWWQGGFIWKWYPESGKTDRDYSPQKKKAEKILGEFYNQNK